MCCNMYVCTGCKACAKHVKLLYRGLRSFLALCSTFFENIEPQMLFCMRACMRAISSGGAFEYLFFLKVSLRLTRCFCSKTRTGSMQMIHTSLLAFVSSRKVKTPSFVSTQSIIWRQIARDIPISALFYHHFLSQNVLFAKK